jgi:hypothetical protein
MTSPATTHANGSPTHHTASTAVGARLAPDVPGATNAATVTVAKLTMPSTRPTTPPTTRPIPRPIPRAPIGPAARPGSDGRRTARLPAGPTPSTSARPGRVGADGAGSAGDRGADAPDDGGVGAAPRAAATTMRPRSATAVASTNAAAP